MITGGVSDFRAAMNKFLQKVQNGEIIILLQANKISVQPITPQIAMIAVKLPAEINKDPADRLIAATAQALDIPLLTADTNLQQSSLLTTMG